MWTSYEYAREDKFRFTGEQIPRYALLTGPESLAVAASSRINAHLLRLSLEYVIVASIGHDPEEFSFSRCTRDCRGECHCSGKTSCTRHSHSPNSFLSSALILPASQFPFLLTSLILRPFPFHLPLSFSPDRLVIKIFSTNAMEFLQFQFAMLLGRNFNLGKNPVDI